MQEWSDSPVHEQFAVKFFLDTNLLIYLVDRTNERLNDFVDLLNQSQFARLVSSQFVIIEFLGARKREQYLRKVVENTESSPEGVINYSSLTKYRNDFEHPDTSFSDEMEDIKKRVEDEIKMLADHFEIEFTYGSLHSGQIHLTKEICLLSKITNQDSLVLASAVKPVDGHFEKVVIMTNDDSFAKEYSNFEINILIEQNGALSPWMFKVNNIPNNNNGIFKLIGRDSTSKEDLEAGINQFLHGLIKEKLTDIYLGKTFPPTGNNFPDDCICFSLSTGKTIQDGIYITIVGKDLDFIITSKFPVSFRHNGAELQGPFTAQQGDSLISCQFHNLNDNNEPIPFSAEIMNSLRAVDNMVFIHPDSR